MVGFLEGQTPIEHAINCRTSKALRALLDMGAELPSGLAHFLPKPETFQSLKSPAACQVYFVGCEALLKTLETHEPAICDQIRDCRAQLKEGLAQARQQTAPRRRWLRR